MATIQIYTEAQILALALSYLQQAYPGKTVKPKTFLGQQGQTLSQLIGAIEVSILNANNDGIPATTTTVNGVQQSLCSSAALDGWSFALGLPSNRGPGTFGRNGAQVAQGGGGNVTGLAGTVIPAGALLTDPTSGQQVQLVSGVTIPGGLTIGGSFAAIVPGAAGNLPAGTVLYWVSPVSGVAPSVTLLSATTGGYDVEGDIDLVLRLLRYLQSRPKGGTAADYRSWAELAVNLITNAWLGIIRAYLYPHRSGLGTEDIVITQGGSGSGRDPGAIIQALCQAFIDSVRPINDSPTVVRPYFDPTQALTIHLLVQTAVGYSFDWTGPSITIVSATTNSITVNVGGGAGQMGLTTLAQAITNGHNPRLQLFIAPQAVPYVVTVIGTTPTPIPGTGNVTLNLQINSDGSDPLPSAPTGVIWPGGGAVLPAALAVLGYVDQVGPSQASGFWDNVTDNWESVVSIGRIAQSALDARGSDGNRVLSYIPGVGDGVGVLIQVGSGGFTSDDFHLTDNVPNQGPQLPACAQILVISS